MSACLLTWLSVEHFIIKLLIVLTVVTLTIHSPQVKDEKAILSNRYGSSRYTEFIQGLGHLVRLPEPDQEASSYVGALTSADGKFTYTWHDESMMGGCGCVRGVVVGGCEGCFEGAYCWCLRQASATSCVCMCKYPM